MKDRRGKSWPHRCFQSKNGNLASDDSSLSIAWLYDGHYFYEVLKKPPTTDWRSEREAAAGKNASPWTSSKTHTWVFKGHHLLDAIVKLFSLLNASTRFVFLVIAKKTHSTLRRCFLVSQRFRSPQACHHLAQKKWFCCYNADPDTTVWLLL